MNDKAKTITLCAFSAALAVGFMAATGIPGIKWAILIVAVGASVAITVPLLFNPKNLPFTLLTYLAASAIAVFLGMQNITYVVPIIVFCMPFAIVKVYGESTYVSKNCDTQPSPSDPFEYEEKAPADNENTSDKVKQHIPRTIRMIIYYVLAEAGIAATLVVLWLVTPPLFTQLTQTPLLFAALIAAAQVVPPLYNLLLGGCIGTIRKSLNRFFDK